MEIGDKIMCINNIDFNNSLTVNKYYKILDVNDGLYFMMNDYDIYSGYYLHRFITFKESRKLKLLNINDNNRYR